MKPSFLKPLFFALFLAAVQFPAFAQENQGLSGDPEAIERAKAMVEAMGGLYIWKEIKGIRFVNRWYHIDEKATRIQNEVIDLTQSSTVFEMKSETFLFRRAYSPTTSWMIYDDEVTLQDAEEIEANAGRAMFNLFRIAHGIAIDSPVYQIGLNEEGWLEFGPPGGEVISRVLLNVWNEPLVWATDDFKYTYGPMKQFGNVRLPDWAVYDWGLYRYEMISAETMTEIPDPALFELPAEYRD